MKFKKILGVLIFLMIVISIFPNTSSNAASALITINGKTITSDTTIEQINSMFGSPKLVTPSAFGGNAYTYYGTNYSNYLYIETAANGKIASYGSLDESFVAGSHKYGETKSNTYSTLSGYLFAPNYSEVTGGIFYNTSALGGISNTRTTFKTNYQNDTTKYQKSIAEHATLMYKALAFKKKVTTTAEFNEDIFYANEQLKEFGTNLYELANRLGKESTYLDYYCFVMAKVELERYGALLNPMQYVEYAGRGQVATGSTNCMIFDYNVDTKYIYTYGVDPNLLEAVEKIALSQEEKTKLLNARAEYLKSENYFAQTDENNMFNITPIYKSAPLTAGEVKANKLNGALSLINSMRICADLPKMTLDSNLTESAQYKSTLLSYCIVKYNLNISHNPDKLSEISDDYYSHIGGYSGENLSQAGSNTDDTNLKSHIKILIHDFGESTLGHRGNLLASYQSSSFKGTFSKIGIGYSPYICTNQFNSFSSVNLDAVSWPAKGITLMEQLYTDRFEWSITFLNNYKVQQTTTAIVKCLNTGDTWNFDSSTGTTRTASKSFNVKANNNMIIMYDNSLRAIPEYTYEITVKNLLNTNNNSQTSYTYRTTFEHADENDDEKYATSINIESDNLTNNIATIEVDGQTKLNAIIDNEATNKIIKWESSNKNIAEVTQNGIVTAKATGKCEITATTINGLTKTVTINVISKMTSITVQNSTTILEVGKTEKLSIKGNNGIYVDNLKAEFVSSDTNIARVSQDGIITAVSKGNVTITIKYNGLSSSYTLKILNKTTKPTISITSGSGKEGDTIDLVAKISENANIEQLALNITYDANKLELISTTSQMSNLSIGAKSGTIVLNYNNKELITSAGNLATIKLKIKTGVALGVTTIASQTSGTNKDYQGNNIIYNFSNGNITILDSDILKSDIYKITKNNGKILTGIDISNNTVQTVLNNVKLATGYNANEYTIKIYNYLGKELTSTSLVGTDSTIKIIDKNGKVAEETKIILYGDTNGDGRINAIDALAVTKNKLGTVKLSNERFIEAGRVTDLTRNKNSVPSAIDALLIAKSKLGRATIKQTR